MIEKIEYTQHSYQRQGERAITELQIENVIKRGICVKVSAKGIRGGLIRKFYQKMAGKELWVITEVKSKICYVITAYYKTTEN